eukprot:3141423-Prymnesium_polylepis.1
MAALPQSSVLELHLRIDSQLTPLLRLGSVVGAGDGAPEHAELRAQVVAVQSVVEAKEAMAQFRAPAPPLDLPPLRALVAQMEA